MGFLRGSAAALLVSSIVLASTGRVSDPGAAGPDAATFAEGQRLFYNAQYEPAAALLREACLVGEGDTSSCELGAAALLFQIKRELGEGADRKKAWNGCARCPDLLAAFQARNGKGSLLAKAALKQSPDDEETQFLLSKLALNHVWLELGVLGHKTGWGEYWEARKTLDKILLRNPAHIRARVARAWIDYIVDTRMPRGTRWLLGGGNKKRGLLTVREAANTEAEFFVRTEARFALWDMQVREKNLVEAIAMARTLVHDFPENSDLNRFLLLHDGTASR